jgi:hypothetical protein
MNVKLVRNLGLIALFSQCFSQFASAQVALSGTPAPWPYEYLRGDVVVPCLGDEASSCIWHRLVVDNPSKDTLECRGRVSYDGVNRANAASAERPMVLLPNSRIAVLADSTAPEVLVTSQSVECVVRRPPDESKLTPKCKPTILRMPSEAEYPGTSMHNSEEGPVLLEFSLSNKEGAPTDIVVVGSSLWPKLDESGVKYVSQFLGYTDCKHGRFRVPVSFRLR